MLPRKPNKSISIKIVETQEKRTVRSTKFSEIDTTTTKHKEYLQTIYNQNDANGARSSEEVHIKSGSESSDGQFDYIEDAYLLALADDLDLQQAEERKKNRKPHYLPATQGFLNVQEFAGNEIFVTPDENELSAAEEEITPKKGPQSIVEQILEDFCSSPQTPRSSALEKSLRLRPQSPTFEFKHKIVYTYSRQSKLDYTNRRNLLKQFQDHQSDDSNSFSSDLSIQEDLTQIEVDPPTEEDAEIADGLNESVKVYENLLNLSVYFSQQSDEKDLSEELSQKLAIDLEQESDPTESQIAYDSASQNVLEVHRSNLSQHLFELQLLSSHLSDQANHFLRDILEIRQTYPIDWLQLGNSFSTWNIPFLGFTVESALVHECENMPKVEAQIFSDDECEDFFVNFKTQEIVGEAKGEVDLPVENMPGSQTATKKLPKDPSRAINSNELQTFTTASKKPIEISEEARTKAENILAELPDLPNESSPATSSSILPSFTTASKKKPIEISEEARKKAENILAELPELPNYPSTSNSSNQLPTFTTASKKPIEISEEARKKAENILAELPELPNVSIPASNLDELPTFTTASKKPIEISEEARKKAENILAELPELPNDSSTSNSSNQLPTFTTASKKPIEISEEARKKAENILAKLPELPNVSSSVSDSNKLPTFTTASKKPIEISEEARKKAENILAELPELPNVSSPASNLDELPTFTTASKKPIEISEEARKKAEEILLELPELKENSLDGMSLKENQPEDELEMKEMENYANMQLSEWAYVGTAKAAEPEKELLPMLELENTSSTIMENNCNKSNGKECEVSIGSTNSSLNISSRKLMARKNLLSLSKRRKHKKNTPKHTTGDSLQNEYVAHHNTDETHTPVKNISSINITAKQVNMETPRTATVKTGHVLTASTPLANPLSRSYDTPETPVNNITLNTSHNESTKEMKNPSDVRKSAVKQRLERLNMYGEPPALSPIPHVTPQGVNNCRPSGLRRSSNRLKK